MYKLFRFFFKKRKPVSRYFQLTFRSLDDMFFDGDTICYKIFKHNMKLKDMESCKNFVYSEGFIVKDFSPLFSFPEIYLTKLFYDSLSVTHYIASSNVLVKREKILLTERITKI